MRQIWHKMQNTYAGYNESNNTGTCIVEQLRNWDPSDSF